MFKIHLKYFNFLLLTVYQLFNSYKQPDYRFDFIVLSKIDTRWRE